MPKNNSHDRPLSNAIWRERLKSALEEGQGVYDLWTVSLDRLPELYEEGEQGDQEAKRLHDMALWGFMHVFRARGTSRPALCLLCPHEFTMENGPPTLVAVVFGHVDSPEYAICNALCWKCSDASDARTLIERVVAAYSEMLPGARIISPIGEPGHA